MSLFILDPTALSQLTRRLATERDCLAPAATPGGGAFLPIDPDKGWRPEPNFSANPEMPLKALFFPRSETLLRFNNTKDAGGMVFSAETPQERPRVVFGVRPCDAQAALLLDAVFLHDENAPDVYWKDKRESTALFGLACNEPCPTCFCHATGSGPHDERGLDALFTDLGDRFLVKALTETGKRLLAGLPEASEADAAQAKACAATSLASMTPTEFPLQATEEAQVMDLYNLPLWERLAEQCLNCGACTFVCPTCHCFDIQDETKGRLGRRIRAWDSCMFPLFTLHASGHNPRGTKTDRVRQRFLHKLKYLPMKRGLLGCVGCGRCVRLCPVNIDIRQTAVLLNEQAQAKRP